MADSPALQAVTNAGPPQSGRHKMVGKGALPRATTLNKGLQQRPFSLNRVHQVVAGLLVQQFAH